MSTLFWVLCRFTLASLYSCSGAHLKAPSHMLHVAHIFNQQISHKEPKHIQSSKRPRPLASAVSNDDDDAHPKPKRRKVSRSPLASVADLNKKGAILKKSSTILNNHKGPIKPKLEPLGHLYENENKKINKSLKQPLKNNTSLHNPQIKLTQEVLDRLPNTSFFKSLKLKLHNDQNTPLSQGIIEKLDALHQLKISYTFLSSMLKKCNDLHPCDALLNKIVVKCDRAGYTIETKLQNMLHNNIKLSSLSAMLHNCSNQAVTLDALINKITEKEMLYKLEQLKKIGCTMSNLSSMLTRSGNQAAQAYEKLINKITDEEMLRKLTQLKLVGYTINNLSSILHGCGKQAVVSLDTLINNITGEKMLRKLEQLKLAGYTVNNLSSMLNGSGNQAAQAYEKLINKITDEEMLRKLTQLKLVGYTVNNLSSMLSGSGNQAYKTFKELINTLTEMEMLAKLSQLKEVGCTMSNLSRILHRSGNQIYKTFKMLLNTLTEQKMLTKLKQLKAQGIHFSHLWVNLSGPGIKVYESLSMLIDLLSNHKYINTIKKVTTAMYSRSDVINPNDEILISRRASALLHNIGNLKNIPSVNDPTNEPTFKKFLTNCYIKNKHLDDSLLKVQKVDNDDPRIDLRGQDKVVAKKKILKGTILGIYTGILLCDQDPIDNAVELAYLATKNIYGLNKLNSYSFEINLGTNTPLYLSACGRGNMLMNINANKTYNDKDSPHKSYTSNVAPSLNSCDGITPFILFYATHDIPANEELLFDYGKPYWSNHDNNHDLSNPDARIYRDLLTTKKYLKQAESIRFLRLIKEHDYELYQNLLKHINAPSNDLPGKDRLVECRKINSPNKNKTDYRIYKLPGESYIGEPSQDYFSIKWEPSVSLDRLDKYTWSDVCDS